MQQSYHNGSQTVFSIDSLLASSRRPDYEGYNGQFMTRFQNSFGFSPTNVSSEYQTFGGMLKQSELHVCLLILLILFVHLYTLTCHIHIFTFFLYKIFVRSEVIENFQTFCFCVISLFPLTRDVSYITDSLAVFLKAVRTNLKDEIILCVKRSAKD